MSCGGAGGACGGGGFGGGVGFVGTGGAGSGSAPARRVKVIKGEYGDEKWVIVEGHRTIDVNQPDPNRQALSGVPTAGKLGGVRYTYGDELPKKITQALVCAVICSILGTPLSLICMIPMIRKLKKTQQVLAEGSLTDAREHYRRSNGCFILTLVWVSFLITVLAVIGILLGIFLGVFLNRQPCNCT